MGNVRLTLTESINAPDYLPGLDPFPCWSALYNWPPEDSLLLCAPTKAERNCCFCSRHCPHINPVDARRLFYRIVWDICTVWRFPCNDRGLRRKHTGDRTVHQIGDREIRSGKKK